MQRRMTAALSLILLTSAMAGCTSDAPDDNEVTSSAPTTEAAAPADPDWFCRLIGKELVDAATDGRSDVAREINVLDKEDRFQCDVIVPTTGDETEVAMSLSIHRNVPGEADARLAEIKALDGLVPGPEHLGVSYIANTLAVAVVPCKAMPGAVGQTAADGAVAEVPYVFTLRAQLDTEGAANKLMDRPLTRMVTEMDRSYGCSPSKIAETDTNSSTEAPADDAEGTTAP